MSEEVDTEKSEEIHQSLRLVNESVDKLVDKMIKQINKQFKKEPKDEVTRNDIIKFIKSNYCDDFNLEKVDTHWKEDIDCKRNDCLYWLFILTSTKLPNKRIYVQI